MRFYQLTMGTYDLPASLLTICTWTLAWAIFLLAGEALLPRIDRVKRLILLALLLMAAFFALDLVNWRGAGSPLIVVCAWATIHSYRSREPSRFAFCLFALLLLGKIALNVTLSNYGFALALPAICAAVCFFSCWREGLRLRDPRGVRWATIGGIVLLSFVHLVLSIRHWNAKTVLVAQGGDGFYVSPDRATINDILTLPPANGSLAVIPQGAMVNYLLRSENPTGVATMMPPEVEMFGEAQILRRLTEHPPQTIVFLPPGVWEYGYDSFDGYAPEVARFLESSYTRDVKSGFWLLTRKP
jgi:hypothetical protein